MNTPTDAPAEGKRSVVKVRVTYPWGSPVLGAKVSFHIVKDVLDGNGDQDDYEDEILLFGGSGVTNTDGVCETSVDWSAGGGYPQVSLRAWLVDESGVNWEGRTNLEYSKLDPKAENYDIELERSSNYATVDLRLTWAHTFGGLSATAIAQIASQPGGESLLRTIDELESAIRNNLPASAGAMAGVALEETIRIRGAVEMWWEPEWDEREWTLSDLLGNDVIRKEINHKFPGYWKRLKGVCETVRNLSVHHSEIPVTMFEAQTAKDTVLRLIGLWWATDVSTGTDEKAGRKGSRSPTTGRAGSP